MAMAEPLADNRKAYTGAARNVWIASRVVLVASVVALVAAALIWVIDTGGPEYKDDPFFAAWRDYSGWMAFAGCIGLLVAIAVRFAARLLDEQQHPDPHRPLRSRPLPAKHPKPPKDPG